MNFKLLKISSMSIKLLLIIFNRKNMFKKLFYTNKTLKILKEGGDHLVFYIFPETQNYAKLL